MNYFNKLIISLVFISIIISIFFIPSIISNDLSVTIPEYLQPNANGYNWPIPGYTRVSSPFGRRTAPATGASTFHTGVDFPAPEGTDLIAINDGTISFTGFLGGGGYSITLSFDNIKVSYCHVSPNYIVSVGDNVIKGQVIGQVGPTIVYGVKGNQYSDSQGNPTNGATTGCHLHFGFRIDNKYQNPLDFY